MKWLFFILVVAGVGLAYLWWRGRQVKADIDAAIDVGKQARNVFSGAPVVAPNGEPMLAAGSKPDAAIATLLYSLAAMKRRVTTDDAAHLARLLETAWSMPASERESAMAFAAWATANVGSADKIARGYLPLWKTSLQPARKKTLVTMAQQVADLGGAPTAAQSALVKRLSDGLLGK